MPRTGKLHGFSNSNKTAHEWWQYLNVSGQPTNCQEVDQFPHLATPIDVKPRWLKDETEIPKTKHLTKPAKTASSQYDKSSTLFGDQPEHMLTKTKQDVNRLP